MDGWMMAQAVSGCSGKESKIGWETLQDDPPESFMVCKEAELEWIERNALVMERQDSVGKGGSLQVQHPAPPRYVKTTKPSIIGLPKSQKAAYAEQATNLKHRRPTTSTHHLFPSSSKSRSGAAALTEPSSPRVSCIGRVRSRRARSKKTTKNPHAQSQSQSQPPAIKPSRSIRIQKTGFFWANFRSLFGSRPHKHPESSEATRSSRKPNCSAMQVAVVKQFTSGRRSDAWAADLDQIGKLETHRKELTI